MAKLLRENFERDRNFQQLQALKSDYNDILLGLNYLKSTFAGCNINVDIRIGTDVQRTGMYTFFKLGRFKINLSKI